jgi:hypothetical protein
MEGKQGLPKREKPGVDIRGKKRGKNNSFVVDLAYLEIDSPKMLEEICYPYHSPFLMESDLHKSTLHSRHGWFRELGHL